MEEKIANLDVAGLFVISAVSFVVLWGIFGAY